ncbi:hypothetical protein [Methylobacterium iners]|uniref:hypothetical protein n=1 Tax=Methylobacterium iners TaxID=418707 RepID=UPI001EE30B63|nr:hypothetical protein [Methylobacterium iners]
MEEELSIPIDNHRTLCLTEISRQTFEDQALHELGSDAGLFLVVEDCVEGTFDVLAKAAPGFSGHALLQMISRALTSDRPRLQVVS